MVDYQDHAPHENSNQFVDALSFTAARTGFSSGMVEKDYYCSLALHALEPLFRSGLVFKGGTSLSKVHASFYRLSEDLDFGISTATSSSRAVRRKAIDGTKQYLDWWSKNTRWFTQVQALTGANQSSQYTAVFSYVSQLTGQSDTIKIEVGLREPLLEPAEQKTAETLLLNPNTAGRLLEPIAVVAMSRRESYAEKIRACLSRRDPAIRDFFDVDHAMRARVLDIKEDLLLKLVRRKIEVSPNEPPDVSLERLQTLRDQLEPQLRPVLRMDDLLRFDLERTFEAIREIYGMIQ